MPRKSGSKFTGVSAVSVVVDSPFHTSYWQAALAAEVREAFKSAHPNFKAGGRTIGHCQGQEWLSVPAAMAVAFPLESFPSSLSIHM